MTYPKLADRTFTKEDALKILKDVVSRPETTEATFKTIMEGSPEHRELMIQADMASAVQFTVEYRHVAN
jgi:hypothetical protein